MTSAGSVAFRIDTTSRVGVAVPEFGGQLTDTEHRQRGTRGHSSDISRILRIDPLIRARG